jgi:hypothetical protein
MDFHTPRVGQELTLHWKRRSNMDKRQEPRVEVDEVSWPEIIPEVERHINSDSSAKALCRNS